MFNKKKFEKIDFEIKNLWDTRNADISREKNRLDGDKNVNCIKCGMLGLTSKMKCDKKIISNEVGAVFDDSLKIYYYDDTIVDKIITECTCVHCQKKDKKKTA